MSPPAATSRPAAYASSSAGGPGLAAVPAATDVGTIDEVLAALDVIVERARRARCRSGYFAALYRATTARVQTAIHAGRFDDAARMERLDVVFANRYLAAEAAWRAGRPVPRVWAVAFATTRRWAPLVVQHLLLGMTAHIGYDLALAAAQVAPGDALPALRRDFREIDRVLHEMIDDVQAQLAAVSPLVGLLDWIGDRTDEAICGFCLAQARDCAWGAAERLALLQAPADAARRVECEAALDRLATALTIPLRTPGPLARLARLGVRVVELGDPARVLDLLHDVPRRPPAAPARGIGVAGSVR